MEHMEGGTDSHQIEGTLRTLCIRQLLCCNRKDCTCITTKQQSQLCDSGGWLWHIEVNHKKPLCGIQRSRRWRSHMANRGQGGGRSGCRRWEMVNHAADGVLHAGDHAAAGSVANCCQSCTMRLQARARKEETQQQY
eukprot:scaffold168389_cov24-Tisochrysis_lutea.AAC.1